MRHLRTALRNYSVHFLLGRLEKGPGTLLHFLWRRLLEATPVEKWVLVVVLVEERSGVRLQEDVVVADVVGRSLVGDHALTQVAEGRLLMRCLSRQPFWAASVVDVTLGLKDVLLRRLTSALHRAEQTFPTLGPNLALHSLAQAVSHGVRAFAGP